jgi:hypothetical protein
MSNLIKRAKIERMGGDAKFQELRDANYERILEEQIARSESDTILGGTPNKDLTQEQLMAAAEDRTLGLGRKTGSYREEARMTRIQTRDALSQMMGSNYIVEKDGKNVALQPKDFSDKELFDLRSTFSKNGRQTPKTREMLETITESRGGTYEGRNGFFDRFSDRPESPRLSVPK